jgi:hypothetical protein
MKKIILFLLLFQIFYVNIKASGLDPEEVIFDNRCVQERLLVTPISVTGTGDQPICNYWCKRGIILAGDYCQYNSTSAIGGSWVGDLETPLRIRPVDAVLIYLRGALYAVMGAVALAVIFYAIYGWYTHAMSEGKPEKLEEVKKIYTNAVIGALIIIMSFVVVQILSVFVGVTDSIIDITFIPKSGYRVDVKSSDVGRVCFEEQTDINNTYTCVDGRWAE